MEEKDKDVEKQNKEKRCKQCLYRNNCKNKEDEQCEKHVPLNWRSDAIIEEVSSWSDF